VNLKVEIINKGEGMKVERQETSTGPDGQKVLRVMVTNIVKGGMANGEFDGALGQSFGLKRQGYANG
ncbi:MAG: hypothetical protein LOY58_08025, partial [Gammaproteobacteria bacterium]|nr:hypothetical protein [Gammaproteobacteria bacterium]